MRLAGEPEQRSRYRHGSHTEGADLHRLRGSKPEGAFLAITRGERITRVQLATFGTQGDARRKEPNQALCNHLGGTDICS